MNIAFSGLFTDSFFIIGIATFAGLLAQKKPLEKIISGTIKTLMGILIISFGANMVIQAITILMLIIQNAFHIFGIVPNNESIVAIIQIRYSYETAVIMFIGMFIHLLIAKFSSLKYLFLNGYYTFYMAALLGATLVTNISSNFTILLIGGSILGILMSVLPALAQPFVFKITGKKSIALGFFGTFACIFSGYLSKLLFRKKELDHADGEGIFKKKFSSNLFLDSSITVCLFMFVLVVISSLFANKDVLKDLSGQTNYMLFIFKQPLIFSSGFYIILVGVRMFTEEILYAFKGIGDKIIPNAIPALDTPILFTYNPSMVFIGFIFSLLGAVVAIFIQLYLGVRIVLPGIISHFFSGATSGLFGYVYGGKKGAIFSSFVHGILISFLSLLAFPIFSNLGIIRTTFGDSDFSVVSMLLKYVLDFINTFH